MAVSIRPLGSYARALMRLLVFYIGHPRVLLRHFGKVADTLKQGGVPLLRARAMAAFRGLRSGGGPVYGGETAHQRWRKRGTILIVTHDAELGGAQQVARTFAEWMAASTFYDIKIVMMRGGSFAHRFNAVAPTCNIAAMRQRMSPEEVEDNLHQWAGDVKAIFLNSAASGGFLDYWKPPTPVIAFIHELPKILKLFETEFALIRERADRIICGSEAVRTALESLPGEDGSRLRVVTGFIEASPRHRSFDFEAKRAAKRALGLDEDEMLVAACGVVHWRKSPEAFVEVADQVMSGSSRPTRFIWVGGGPDKEHCEALVRAKGLEEKVRFTGYEPDVQKYLDAADLFLLPSEEDPFPLVCLYAALARAPVICFEEAGGMPGFVAHGAGRAVPFKNNAAMAAAVREYLSDAALREAEGRAGQALVLSEFTIDATGPVLLEHIRETAGLAPMLSVIVPNYNCEPYLEERLASITGQRFQDFELILFDDRSTDGSLAILEKLAASRPRTRLIVNEVNSGSPFPQWLKGMEMAAADVIWVAEADDACEPELAGTLLAYFDSRNVFLAHAKSVPIGADGQVLGDYEPIYLDRIAPRRWSRSHVVTDHEEAAEGLGIANSIPNASGVLFRKFSPEPSFRDALLSMKLCGDWFFYLRAMRGGQVAYSARPLNLHRRHEQTVTQKTEGSRLYFDEFEAVRRAVVANYRLPEAARQAIRRFTVEDLDRFDVTDPVERRRVLAFSPPEGSKALPALLVVVSDLSPGGGQLFGIRLANAWSRAGGRAVLLNVRHFPDHARVVEKIDPSVALYHADEMDMSFGQLLERFDIDIVHSSIWWADRHVEEHSKDLGTRPWIVTMHGCYETHLDHPGVDMSFPSRMPRMLDRVNLWVHTADKNRRVFSKYGSPRAETRIRNGIEVEPSRAVARAELGLRPDATVICLASRAIAEKGWHEAVELTTRLNAEGHAVDLMLIGEGPAADAIAEDGPEHVRLVGQVSNLQDYLAVSDIGILPSTFVGESMPLVLLEMMAKGKPVVATDVGEIADMIGTGPDAAGHVVPLVDGAVDMDAFRHALTTLLDPGVRRATGEAARRRFEAGYRIETMLDAYGAEYARLLAASDYSRPDRQFKDEVAAV